MDHNPYQAPTSNTTVVATNDHTRESLKKIARYQRLLVGFILAYLILAVAATIFSYPPPLVEAALGLGLLCGLIACVVLTFLLARNVYSLRHAMILTALAIFPGLGLFVSLAVSVKGTQTLRQNGIKVGFFGADRSTL